MRGQEKDTAENLEFFRAAILEPALRYQHLFGESGVTSTVADFGAVEAAHWASLGVQVGYFDDKDAHELISSSEGVFNAWSNLQDRRIISPESFWAAVIQARKMGPPTLNKDLFYVSEKIEGITAWWRQWRYRTFQILLLLAAEHIFVEDSCYFMDSIGWTGDEEWNARRAAAVHPPLIGSAQHVGSGFANVLNYWEEVYFSFADASNHWEEMYFSPIPSNTPIHYFTESARIILTERFNLSQTNIVERYFVLAGEFTKRVSDDNPAWRDARLKVFERLIVLIKYIGGEACVKGYETRLWNLFTGSGSSAMGTFVEASPAQTLWRKPKAIQYAEPEASPETKPETERSKEFL